MIHVADFKKTFYIGLRRKPFIAAEAISFEVEGGEIFGFLGPNGAGKTTTIKALLGLIRPDGGTLRIFGEPVTSLNWRQHVGYMPEHPNFYEYLTGLEMVTWFGRLAGLSRAEGETRGKRLLERVGLGGAMTRRLRSYSKGMLQRAGLAQALIGDPKLLILDEPMTGLDPVGRRDMRELILGLRSEGKTVFYSTHILPDVELTCDRVAIIHRGRTRKVGRLEDILSETNRAVTFTVAKLSDNARETFQAQFPEVKWRDGALSGEFVDTDRAQLALKAAIAAGGEILRYQPHRPDLETVFMQSLDGRA